MTSDWEPGSPLVLPVRVSGVDASGELRVSIGTQRGAECELVLDDGRAALGTGDDAWAAFQALRAVADSLDVLIGCNAARSDYRVSALASQSSSGRSGYIVSSPNRPLPVDAFSPTNLEMCVSQADYEQELEREREAKREHKLESRDPLDLAARANPGQWVFVTELGVDVASAMPQDTAIPGAWRVDEHGVRVAYLTNPNWDGTYR